MLSYIIAALLAGATPASGSLNAATSAGVLSLSPGQSATVQVSADGATAASPTALRAKGPRFSGDAVRFELQDMGEQGVLLSVQNGYGRTLVYRAEMYLASGAHVHTSTCPVLAHITGMESWQDPIVSIEISDLTLTDSKEMICK